MIVYPEDWKQDYSELVKNIGTSNPSLGLVIERLRIVLKRFTTKNLAYSGGIDSTILLALMSETRQVNTFTIASRVDHPDVLYSKIGSKHYKANHHIFICPDLKDQPGDIAVQELFKQSGVSNMVCGDGIDELMCGYYFHQVGDIKEQYEKFLKELTPKHLIPLDKNSQHTRVYLPYLDPDLVDTLSKYPLEFKVNHIDRKILMLLIGHMFELPIGIIKRNKYGFCDALRSTDK